MSFDWQAARRVSPTAWLDQLRARGARLVGANAQAVVDEARSVMIQSGRAQVGRVPDKAQWAALTHEFGFAQEWALSGFPQVLVSDQLFASFAATAIPHELVSHGLPWRTFVVRIPEMFHEPIDWGRGLFLPPAYMSVRRVADSNDHFSFEIHPSDAAGAAIKRTPKTLGDLVDANQDGPIQRMDWGRTHHSDRGVGDQGFFEAVGDLERPLRIINALQRAFVGVVLELEGKSFRDEIAKGRPRSRALRRGIPKAWNFHLRRPVVVDCREWLKALAKGEVSRSITVQSLVRGHWKNQPCGPGRTERKFIHIEPYWRGPEDAPIAVRPHILG